MTPAQAISRSEVVVFDLFHTLVSFKSDGTSGGNTSDALGIPEDDWNKLLWKSSDRRLRHNDRDDVSIIRELAHLHNPSIPEEAIINAARLRAARFRECLMNPPDARLRVTRTLHERGHKLILLSNADSMEIRGWYESPFAPFFTAALFSCDIGHIKPEAECYRKALQVCQVLPAQAIFVGDGGSDELKGARAFGIPTVMTTEIVGQFWPHFVPGRMIDADYSVASLNELL